MAERLVTLYKIGEGVEITFDGDVWWQGQVVKLDHPGIWVQTEDGRPWLSPIPAAYGP